MSARDRTEADYLLALKGNQGTLREDVALLFVEQDARDDVLRGQRTRFEPEPHRQVEHLPIHRIHETAFQGVAATPGNRGVPYVCTDQGETEAGAGDGIE